MKLLEVLDNHVPPSLASFVSDYRHVLEGISNHLEVEDEEGKDGLHGRVTPRVEMIFSAFNLVSLDPEGLFPNSLKVVFMFQDTYPTPGCACGVALATLNGKAQPSLNNFYRRLSETYKVKEMNEAGEVIESNMPPLFGGDIRGWCTQGVLMYNAALTTRERETESHLNEWSLWSVPFVKWLSETFPYLVFVLCGKKAQAFGSCINGSKHTILKTSHPSGLGYHAGFHQCDVFNEVNEYLTLNKREPIRWEDYKYVNT